MRETIFEMQMDFCFQKRVLNMKKELDAALLIVWAMLGSLVAFLVVMQLLKVGLILGQRPEYIVLSALVLVSKIRLAVYCDWSNTQVGVAFVIIFSIVKSSLVERISLLELYLAINCVFVPGMWILMLLRIVWRTSKCGRIRDKKKKASISKELS